jgi:CheY-like chemotaxis protein
VQALSGGEGLGATFIVKLPVASVRDTRSRPHQDAGFYQADGADPSAVIGSGPEINNAPTLNGIRILIVDDEADAREMLEVILGQFGAQVKASTSAQEALNILEDWKPDVLVSDIGMPHEDGYSLIHQVRALGPDQGGRTPAVALTGYSRPEDRSRLLAAGYQIHLPKPVEIAQLADAIVTLSGRVEKGY